jgi:hypothetical protein
MRITEHPDQDPTLPPPGSRSGAGAQSVLPYLTKSLQARPASVPEPGRDPRAHPDPGAQERPARIP